MNKIIISILLISIFVSCETKPYVKHKIRFEKVADVCSGTTEGLQLNSNILGERYEFNKCLPEDFNKDLVNVSRQGDTVVVRFGKNLNKKRADFHIILDIDAYPRYNFLTIDGETFIIVPASG